MRIWASACSELSSKISQSSSVCGSTETEEAWGMLEATLTWTGEWIGKEMQSANSWETWMDEGEEEVAPDQATNQDWVEERSSRARIGGSGDERVEWRVWIRGKGRDAKQLSMVPTASIPNSIFNCKLGTRFTQLTIHTTMQLRIASYAHRLSNMFLETRTRKFAE